MEVTFGVTINVERLKEVTFKSNDAQLRGEVKIKCDSFFNFVQANLRD